MPGASSFIPLVPRRFRFRRSRCSGSVSVRRIVAHCGCRGERAQYFVIYRMERSGTHCRDSRRAIGIRQRIEPHEQPRGSISGDRIFRDQASDDRGQPSSAVIERDDASRLRGLRRRKVRRATLNFLARRARKGRGQADVAESAHGGSCCSLGTSCNYKITICKRCTPHRPSRSRHGYATFIRRSALPAGRRGASSAHSEIIAPGARAPRSATRPWAPPATPRAASA
jgi:hypothetical protein